MDRRQFSRWAGSALLLGAHTAHARARLRVLVLGGTQFIGVHMVNEALRRGHEVTLFNRGLTHPELFPRLEKLRGDRNGQLDALRGRSWDAVIDDSGFTPRQVALSTGLLAGSVGTYVYLSSIAAYASFRQANDEAAPLAELHESGTNEVTGATYGPFKALSERVVRAAFPRAYVVLRPGFVVGPGDAGGRFNYWLANAAIGGTMLAPGTPEVPLQFADARDLARFALDLVEQRHSGTWNVVSPPGRFRMGAFVSACLDSARRRAHPAEAPRAEWLPLEFLEQQGVDPLAAFPLWPPGQHAEPALAAVSSARAAAAGLRSRPLNATVEDTMAWLLTDAEAWRNALAGGMPRTQQTRLIDRWHQR